MLAKSDFPKAFNEQFSPAITRCRCPKCKSGNLLLIESLEASTAFEVRNGRLNRQAGIHEFGSFFALNAKCDDCGHGWRVKKSIQITDVVTDLDPKTFEPIEQTERAAQ